MRVRDGAALFVTAAALAGMLSPLTAANGQPDGPQLTIASTSGVPHVDVADYRTSPHWRDGMPVGANVPWRRFMRHTVDEITAGADWTLHGGDQVHARWHRYGSGGPELFGPDDTHAQRRRMVRTAGDVIYPWLNQWWPAKTLFAVGDHEVGDMLSTGIIPRTDRRYRLHSAFKAAWREHHHNRTWYMRDLGPVTVVTLDPFTKWRRGIVANVPPVQLAWLRDRVDRAHREGDWVIVQVEVPAVGPNNIGPDVGTSRLTLRNGGKVLDAAADADLLLAGEFHTPTTRITAQGPVQIVHGGSGGHTHWLRINAHPDRLVVTAHTADTKLEGNGTIWAPTGPFANSRPVSDTTHLTGAATLRRDGRWSGTRDLQAVNE